jgi:hypoxia-inducible factor 1 alpha
MAANNKIHTVITSIVTKKNQLNSGNKRAAAELSTNAKRLKACPMTERLSVSTPVTPTQTPPPIVPPSVPQQISQSQSSPQLLQQLMAPSPVPQSKKPLKSKYDSGSGSSRWTDGQMINGLHEQASNSVLMNLLVSGCDVSAGYTCFPRPKAAKA